MVKKTELEKKIPDVSGFLLTSVFNSKITEVENKVPDVSNLVTKTNYAEEVTKIKNGYVTNTALDVRHNDSVQKTTFKSELKEVGDKTSENSSKLLSYKHKLKPTEDATNDLERDTSYFRGKNYFGDNGMQNYFVFQPMYKYFIKVIDSIDNPVYAHYWQSKGLSDGKINAPGTSSSNDKAPILEYGGAG